ncbi:hypothetical protein niasHT_016885 [Heterodera trifolii]|uniref:polynucleotide adenylyltransferase n=1 Tax=Heterodera trifolii TaxID=157864 RepID=A0ABD2KTK6_9BILA
MRQSKKKNFKFAIVFWAILIFLALIEKSNGGKAKKVAKQKQQNVKQSERSAEGKAAADNETVAENRKCPEKGEMAENFMADEDSIELIGQFKKLIISEYRGTLSAQFERKFQENSLIWHFTQKISELLSADTSQFSGNSVDELEAKIEHFRNKWAQLKKYQKNADRMFVICILYKYSTEMIGETADLKISDWDQFLKGNRLREQILKQTDQISCEEPMNDAPAIYEHLMSEANIKAINGQNLANLLEISQNFRQFFCHEVNMTEIKTELDKHIDEFELYTLEINFPEIIRLDITLDSTLFIRCKTLLLHRSDSEQFKGILLNWAMGQLVDAILHSVVIDSQRHPLNISNGTLKTIEERVRSVITSAYRNPKSEEHLCALIKMHQFIESISPKNAHKINEKMVKRWNGLTECAEVNERRRTVEQFEASEQRVQWMEQSLVKAYTYARQSLLEILMVPGAKTRMARLIGSRERFDRLLTALGVPLEQLYKEDVFIDNNRFWAHYKLVFERQTCEDQLWIRSIKLGADLFAFVRWVKRKLARENQLEIWGEMRHFVTVELYDPIFDMTEEQMNSWGNILEKIFERTKTFLKKMKKNTKNFFKKWKETAVDEAKKNEEKLENGHKFREWMEKLHRRELTALLEMAFWSQFNKTIMAQNIGTLKENMQVFFTEKTISEFCDEMKNRKTFVEESLAKKAETEKGEKDGTKVGAVTETTEDEHQMTMSDIEKELKKMLLGEAKQQFRQNENREEGEDKVQKLEEDKVPNLEEDKVSKLEEDKVPKLEEDKVPKLEEDKVSKLKEDKVSKLKEDKVPKLEEDKVPKLEDDKVPKLEDDKAPKLEDDKVPKLEEDKVPKLEDDKVPKLEDDKAPKLEDDKVPKLDQQLQQAMALIHFSCPTKEEIQWEKQQQKNANAIDEMANSLLKEYFSFLEDNEQFEIDLMESAKKVMTIKMLGVLWWLRLVCEELVLLASILAFEFPPLSPFIVAEAAAVGKHWDELLQNVDLILENEQQIFLLYKFVLFLYSNETMRKSSEKWTTQLRKAPLVHILFKDFGKEMCDGWHGEWKMPKYDQGEATQIYESLTARENAKQINFFSLSILIERFKKFQMFFCEMDEEKLEKGKMKLSTLIGEEGVVRLDELHPEVLQITVPVPFVHCFLYKRFLRVPSFSAQSLPLGARLIVPLILRDAGILCANIPKSTDRSISNAFQSKYFNLRRSAFLALRNGPNAALLSIVCLLHRFTKYLVISVKLNEFDRTAIKATDILNWTDRKCESDAEEQRKAFQQQCGYMRIYHHDLLKRIIETNVGRFTEFVKRTRGARARAAKLISEEQKSLLRIYHSRLSDSKAFSDEHLLFDYSAALFEEETMRRVVGTLSAQLSVWIRWMDSELTEEKNANRTIGLRKVYEKVWANAKLNFEDIYDAIVDNDLNELERLGYFLREFIPKAKEFVDKKRTERFKAKQKQAEGGETEKRTHPLMAKWEKMVDEARAKAAEMQLTEEEETETERWEKRTHTDTLIGLIGKATTRTLFREGFHQKEEAKERLINFIPFELVDDFLVLLEATDKKEFEGKIKKFKQKMDREENKTNDETAKLADQNMKNLIREEERVKELREKMADRQAEKRKRRRENEQKRKTERERRRGAKDSDEAETVATTALLLVPSPHGTPTGSEEAPFFDSPTGHSDSPNASPSRHSKSLAKHVGNPVPSPSRHFWYGESPSRFLANHSPRHGSSASQSPSSEGKRRKKVLEKEMHEELANLQKFSSDEFLHFSYGQFPTNPSETKRRILDIGIFMNEISHRTEIVTKISKILENKTEKETANEVKSIKEIETFLREFKETDNWEIETEGQLDTFEGILHDILKRTIFELEGKSNWQNGDEGGEEMGEEVKMVRKQLHRNKLAQAMAMGAGECQKQSVKRIWDGTGAEQQGKLLRKIIGTTKPNLTDRFRDHLDGWRELAEQQRIDRKLYEQFEDKFVDKNSPSLGVDFPQKTQQIYFKSSDDEKQEQFLIALLRENGFNEAPSADAALALKALKALISAWSNVDARLLVTGSYLLGARTTDADIDTICVVRQRFATQAEEMGAFFGKCYCYLSSRICEDNSLYCLLCKHPKVAFLNKAPRAYMPMIELNFFGIDFDVTFVLIPNTEIIPDEPLDATDVKWMMQIMALSAKPHEAMLKSLAGHLANHQMLELMRSQNNIKKFRTVLWILKLWAKSNYIYGNIFGFFNGAALSILAGKIVLWYPNCSVPFLVEKLMFIMMHWKWPMPIKLIDEESKNEFESISWNPSDKSTALIMPIITPSCLAQNASQNVNASTFSIIQNTIRETFVKLRILRDSPLSSEDEQNWWKELFPAKNFTSKYSHFVLIVCMVNFPQHIDQFCRYVERKLRFQLEHFNSVLDQFIENSHLNPNFQLAKETNCPKMTQNHFPICKKWLIGLKIKRQKNGEEKMDEEKRKLVNETVGKAVDTHIHKEYMRSVRMYQNVGIQSRYISEEKLADEWE